MSFPRYPAYKPSGVEWLGEVPEHWEALPIKRIASLQSGTGITADSITDEGPFPVYGGNGVRGYTDANTHEGHFPIIGRQGALCGNINYAKGGFWASEHAVVVTPCKQVEVHWLGETLRAMNLNQYSVSAAQPGLSVEAIVNLFIPWPPRDEQRTISAFLDRETAKIDALIAEQQHMIELLKEKRQAVISHAVTKGLNPDAPMKDSGVEWLGEVPEHWTVTQLRHFTRSLPGFAFSSEGFIQDESKWKLLRGVNVGVSCIRWDETVYWDRQVDDRLDQFVLSPGDLVVGLDRPMIKEGLRVARITQEDCPCMLLQRVAAVKGSKNLSTDYLFFLLSSPYFLAHFEPEATGVSVPHISTGQIDSFVVPIPPPQEQAEVVAFLLAELLAIQRLRKLWTNGV
jgi:type I restriction enzyme S subunit